MKVTKITNKGGMNSVEEALLTKGKSTFNFKGGNNQIYNIEIDYISGNYCFNNIQKRFTDKKKLQKSVVNYMECLGWENKDSETNNIFENNNIFEDNNDFEDNNKGNTK